MGTKTIQVTGSYFCAGFVVENGIVTETAPILRHYRGMTEARALSLLRQKNLRWTVVADPDE